MSKPAKRVAATYKAAAIAPKKYEVEEIVELLESDEFEDSTKAARKIMATAMALLAERNWFVIASRLDGGPGTVAQLYGLFATEGAALKALNTNTLGLFGQAAIFEVNGLTARQVQLEEYEAALPKGCATCSHLEAAHDWPRVHRKGCSIANCRCRQYIRPPRETRDIEPI